MTKLKRLKELQLL